jgi:hypothetical protein
VCGGPPEETARVDASFVPGGSRYRSALGSNTRSCFSGCVEFLATDRTDPLSGGFLLVGGLELWLREWLEFFEGSVEAVVSDPLTSEGHPTAIIALVEADDSAAC